MTLPVRERQVRLLADSRATEPRARLAQASSRAEFVLRLSRTVSAVQHPSRAMEALVGLLVEEMVAFAQVTVFSGIRQITTGMVHECRVTTRAGLAVDTRMPVVDEVVRHGVIEQLLLPSGSERRDVIDQLVPETDLAEALDALGTESLVLLPLVARGRTFGALALARPSGYGFDENALGFLEDLAQRVSVALDANLVVAESRHVASVLRQTMMPTTTRSVPYLDTAVFLRVAHEHEELGGDFYDIHGEDDDLTVLLGDVAGKGVEAAVHAKRIRNAVRTASHVDRDPAWILGLVNRVLCSEAEDALRGHLDRGLRPAAPRPRLSRRRDRQRGPPAGPGAARPTAPSRRSPPRAWRWRCSTRRRTPRRRWSCGPATPCSATPTASPRPTAPRTCSARSGSSAVLSQLGGVKASAVVDQVAIAVTSHIAHRQRDDIALVALRYVPDHG